MNAIVTGMVFHETQLIRQKSEKARYVPIGDEGLSMKHRRARKTSKEIDKKDFFEIVIETAESGDDLLSLLNWFSVIKLDVGIIIVQF